MKKKSEWGWKDGVFTRQPILEPVLTVGELIEQLKRLPPELEIQQGFDEGARLVVYNCRTTPHLEIEECEEP